MTDLSVLIVTYRCRDFARECLTSLLRAGGLDGLAAEVLLLDNAGGDGTPEMVRDEFPEVRIIDNTENLGFARGNNRLASESQGRHLLLLNPDTVVPPGSLARCVAFLDSQPADVAGMTCRVESEDGTLQRDCSRRFVTPWSEVARAFLLDRLFRNSAFFNPEPIPNWDRSDTRPVEALLGAFMLIRRDTWETVGGLDEQFFLMYEDMDWCKRVAGAGQKLLFWPDERITHYGGGSWRHEKVATYANSHRSALQYFAKHHPRALPTVRAAVIVGMALKIGLLRLNLLRKPGDDYTVTHLAMARKAMDALTGRETGRTVEVRAETGGRNAVKLLYVSHVDTVVRMMLPHLDGARAAGFTVDVACNITRHGEDVLAHSDTLWDLPFRRSPLHPANLAALSKLTALLKREEYAIVHAHTPSGGVLGRLAATQARRADGLPLRVYTPHGFHFHRYGSRLSNTLFRTIETHAGQYWSDALLTINREDYDAARQGVAAPERVYHTRGVGVSTEVLDPARVPPSERERVRCEVGAQDGTLLITLIGEMIPRKRHTDALNAFARFHGSHPNTQLLFAGDGPLMDKLKTQATELGITDSVRFLGFRRDIPALLAATDLFLFPSAQEGLPCSIQEALCMEIPVVASDVRGNHDLLDDSCGRLVPLGDAAALAAALSEFAALTPDARHRFGQAGRRKMVQEYDRPVAVAQWLDIYRELLTTRGLPFPDPPPSPPTPAQRLVKL